MGILFRDTKVGEGMEIKRDGKKILEIILKETEGIRESKTATLELKDEKDSHEEKIIYGECLKNLPEGLIVGLGNHQWYEEKASIFYKANDEYKFDRVTSR